VRIIRNSIETGTGPRQWFMGAACDATWGPHVTDAEYGAAPSIEEA
jgi:hypothetical protein